MDELELLKQDWKKQEQNLPNYKAKDIYPMLLKRSSSIVRWIFTISIFELILGVGLGIFFMDDQFWNQLEHIHLKTTFIVSSIISYAVTLGFIYQFYRNYRKISTTDSASKLMKNILRTRKVVRYYIIFVLVSTGISSMLSLVYTLLYPTKEMQVDPERINWFMVIGIGVVFVAVILLILWGIYSLLYGILLKKLKRNYQELRKLEL